MDNINILLPVTVVNSIVLDNYFNLEKGYCEYRRSTVSNMYFVRTIIIIKIFQKHCIKETEVPNHAVPATHT